MGKGARGKSSASTATRKKHAAAAAAKRGEREGAQAKTDVPTRAPDGRKLSKKERKQLAKKKAYVPPPKPPQPPPYPLDSMGLASLLPADLVVLLRKALKKDIVTRIRTLEGLLAWIHGTPAPDADAAAVPTDEERDDALVLALPCWTYLFPRLALSPSQRLRQLALQVHAALLARAPVRDELLAPAYLDEILGYWAVLTYDTSRTVARPAQALWKDTTAWAADDTHVALPDYVSQLLEHLAPILLSGAPALALAESTPSLQPVTAAHDTDVDAKSRDDVHVDEGHDEMNGRLVAGALSVLASVLEHCPDLADDALEPFVASSQGWSVLHMGTSASPVARQRAWAWLAQLNRVRPALVDAHLDDMARDVFAAAWAERDPAVTCDMLGALLPLLKRRPALWLASLDDDEEEEEDDDDDDDHDDQEDEQDGGRDRDRDRDRDDRSAAGPSASARDEPPALRGFLAWLQTGAPATPAACFPAVLVFLSTMPPEALPRTETSLARVVEPMLGLAPSVSRALTDPRAWDAYAGMVCECLVYWAKALGGVTEMLASQLLWVWRTLVLHNDTLTLAPRLRRTAAQHLGAQLVVLSRAAPYEGVHTVLTSMTHELGGERAADDDNDAVLALVVAAWAAPPPLHDDVVRLAHAWLEQLLSDVRGATIAPLAAWLTSAAAPALTHGDSAPRLALLATDIVPSLWTETTAAAAESFYRAYLAHAAAPRDVWPALLRLTLRDPVALPSVLRLTAAAPPAAGPTDADAAAWRSAVADELPSHVDAWLPLLDAPPALVGATLPADVLRALAAQGGAAGDVRAFRLLQAWADHAPDRIARLCDDETLAALPTSVFVHAFLSGADDGTARVLWQRLVTAAGDRADALYRPAAAALADAARHGTAPLARVAAGAAALPAAHAAHVAPTAAELAAAAEQAAAASAAPSLAVFDPVVPLASDAPPLAPEGLARIVRLAAASAALPPADAASTLVPVTLAATLLEDALLVATSDAPGALAVLFPEDTYDSARRALVHLVHASTRRLAAHASSLPDDWHTRAPAAVAAHTPIDALSATLADVWRDAQTSVAHARVLARLLMGVLSLSSATASDAERWVRAGMSVRPASASLGCAVLYATRTRAYATPAHERWRNEAAATLMGVPPAHANTDGARALHLLQCAAAPPDAGHALLPTHRAVLVLQTLQRWLASDEDLAEHVFAYVAALSAELAPLVQGVAGPHLDTMLDVAEENLQALALELPSGWPTLHATLRLLTAVYALQAQEHVAAALAAHADALLAALRSTFVSVAAYAAAHPSAPSAAQDETERALVELMATHLVPAAMTDDERGALVHLLATPTGHYKVQAAALQWYSAATHARVRDWVVEHAVGAPSAAASLDPALLAALAARAPLSESVWDDDGRGMYSFWLLWLAVLEHFPEASLPLRTAFAAQLQAQNLTAGQLLPSAMVLLAGTPRALGNVLPWDAARYAMDEMELGELEPHVASTGQALAAHVYFRALIHLPTQVRDWYLGVRDKQLAKFAHHFTSKYCTPLLAERELRHLRDPAAMAQLQDEAMSVKILSSNEVVATYTVDEHPMEMGVRLPPDYPLHGVEIRNSKRVGVSEAQWRAWLLAVQQMLSGKNGLVLDALRLFKKNAEAKFQGYEGAECAICYSIISPTDETLPTKPCKTCKHKFHGSCLYKWVSTSGASTCPLCRSIL